MNMIRTLGDPKRRMRFSMDALGTILPFPGINSINQSKRDDRLAGGHRDILLPVECVSHGRRLPKPVGLKLPEAFSAPGIGGCKGTAIITEEHQPAGRTQHSAPRFSMALLRQLPRDSTRVDVDRAQNFDMIIAWHV